MNRNRHHLIIFFVISNLLASNPLSELNLTRILKGGYKDFLITTGENQILYVVDRDNQKIYIIDFSGKVFKSFGGKGEGPGEFHGVNELLFAENRLYVNDWGVFIHVFDEKGNFLRLVRTKGLIIHKIKVLKGKIFGVANDYRVEGRKVTVLDAIYLINEKGEVLKKIKNDAWIHKEMQTEGLPGSGNFSSWGWTHPYYPDLKMEVIENHLVYCWTASNKLHFLDETGKPVKSVEVKALTPEKLNRVEIEYFRKLNKRDPAMFIPERKASFYEFFYDRMKKVVVFVLPPPVAEFQNGYPGSYEVVVTDLNFRPLKRLKIKIKRKGWALIAGVYDGKIILRERDEETDQTFIRFIDINLSKN